MRLSQLQLYLADSLATLAVALLLVFFSGCAPQPNPVPSEVSNPNLRMTLQIHPVHPRQLDPTQFQIFLVNLSGQPISDAVVIADLEMPSMEMGENRVTFKSTAPGVYMGTGRFTMAGSWQIHLTAGIKTQTAKKTFPVEVQ